jgi:hypothetical protein
MKEIIQTSGLCINCSNADECSYNRNHTKPIIFCEEFSCADPSGSNIRTERPIILVDSPIALMPGGICSDCENLETCHLQKTDGNVINCEEYR